MISLFDGFLKEHWKVELIFDEKSTFINILNSIIENYSYHKLNRLYKNKEVMQLFSIFLVLAKKNQW